MHTGLFVGIYWPKISNRPICWHMNVGVRVYCTKKIPEQIFTDNYADIALSASICQDGYRWNNTYETQMVLYLQFLLMLDLFIRLLNNNNFLIIIENVSYVAISVCKLYVPYDVFKSNTKKCSINARSDVTRTILFR